MTATVTGPIRGRRASLRCGRTGHEVNERTGRTGRPHEG
jgi:hypothetical protein